MATVRMSIAFDVEFSEELVAPAIEHLLGRPKPGDFGPGNMIATLEVKQQIYDGFVEALLKRWPQVAKDYARIQELVMIKTELPPELYREWINLQSKYAVSDESKKSWERQLEKLNNAAAPV